jgi:hypothetical protein
MIKADNKRHKRLIPKGTYPYQEKSAAGASNRGNTIDDAGDDTSVELIP